MVGRVEVSDREVADVVAAGEPEMLELLSQLVEAPTTLGNEEPGQVIVEEAFRGLLGLEPVSMPIAGALEGSPDPQEFAAVFLQPPLYALDYVHAMGTLYTAVYRPRRGLPELRWPGLHWEHSFDRPAGTRTVTLLQTAQVP